MYDGCAAERSLVPRQLLQNLLPPLLEPPLENAERTDLR